MEAYTETCLCGGIAKVARWESNIPILKCDKCSDEFEGHETSWKSKKEYQVIIDYGSKIVNVKANNVQEAEEIALRDYTEEPPEVCNTLVEEVD